MATAYSVIYDKALSKMREYVFLDMENEEIYEALSPFLESAESDFARICEESLAEKTADGYCADLDVDAQDILAFGIVCHWSTMYVADADKWRNLIGTKDYSVFSPANLLGVTRTTRENFFLEYRDMISRYSYLHDNLIREQRR